MPAHANPDRSRSSDRLRWTATHRHTLKPISALLSLSLSSPTCKIHITTNMDIFALCVFAAASFVLLAFRYFNNLETYTSISREYKSCWHTFAGNSGFQRQWPAVKHFLISCCNKKTIFVLTIFILQNNRISDKWDIWSSAVLSKSYQIWEVLYKMNLLRDV